MATRAVKRTQEAGRSHHIIWENLSNGDDGEPVSVPGARDYTMQVLGTPGVGGSVLLEGTLEPRKNGQFFELPKVSEHRYLRLSLTKNHGHNRLTELMEFSAYAPGGEELRTFRLDRVRTSREKNGGAENQPFKPGERVWINFKPRALSTNAEGSTWLEVDLVLGDSEGNELLRRDKVVNHVAKPPAKPLSPFASLFLDLPVAFRPGKYVVRLIARDRVGNTSAAAKSEFLVGE